MKIHGVFNLVITREPQTQSIHEYRIINELIDLCAEAQVRDARALLIGISELQSKSKKTLAI